MAAHWGNCCFIVLSGLPKRLLVKREAEHPVTKCMDRIVSDLQVGQAAERSASCR